MFFSLIFLTFGSISQDDVIGPNVSVTSFGCSLSLGLKPLGRYRLKLWLMCLEEGNSKTMAIIGAVIGAIFLIIAFLLILFWKFYKLRVNLKVLPSEVRWFYEMYYKNPASWNTEGIPSLTKYLLI